jgi:DNA-binding Lrp family transcriptional regulator
MDEFLVCKKKELQTFLKEIEVRIAEFMKNSRRSDRELAKAVGASQPTISRTNKEMEKEGYIREYIMVPDFERLGFNLMSVSFVKQRGKESADEVTKLRKRVRHL